MAFWEVVANYCPFCGSDGVENLEPAVVSGSPICKCDFCDKYFSIYKESPPRADEQE